MVRNLPAMWETQVRSLGQEDPLEEEMTSHSSIPAWRIPWTEEPGGLQSVGSQRVGHDWATNSILIKVSPRYLTRRGESCVFWKAPEKVWNVDQAWTWNREGMSQTVEVLGDNDQIFLPGESHGQRRLASYSSCSRRVRHDWVTNTHAQERGEVSIQGLKDLSVQLDVRSEVGRNRGWCWDVLPSIRFIIIWHCKIYSGFVCFSVLWTVWCQPPDGELLKDSASFVLCYISIA